MFGLTFEKLLLIGIVAAFLIGPSRLPEAAAWLKRAVRKLRDFADDTTAKVRDEVGDDLGDLDWRKLDPRQYDPRRIVREALLDEPDPSARRGTAAPQPAAPHSAEPQTVGAPPPDLPEAEESAPEASAPETPSVEAPVPEPPAPGTPTQRVGPHPLPSTRPDREDAAA
ncbi:Sec-independent protein translocase TatB [Agromyces seonyuensis]|uniref:Sec-independent protein translocase TatB n=1 Tax=Agromyces seonyuensis TaxID=2662446 RepID=A0A6I4P1E0_9MICO|nr:Sec-independent protein translocase TatB [Agromyces seonyuensis]MWC00367.1 Sec-independent protein translocase TatB [Agromyces seonyuensis]